MKFITLVVLSFVFSSYAKGNAFQNIRLENEISKLSDGIKLKVSLQEILKNCKATENLKSIKVSKNKNRDTNYFEYYYEHQIVDTSLPTVIFFPGGPGAFSIGSHLSLGKVNVVKIDPRGTGCNFDNGQLFSSEEVSTNNAAADITAIIKQEKLSRVILYGQSYGTVLATVAAYELEKQNYHPELVVLEGVVGKAWDNWDVYLGGFVNSGNSFLNQNPNLKNLFKVEPLPLSLPSDFWAWRISMSGNNWLSEVNELTTIANPDSTDFDTTKRDVLFNFEYFKNSRSVDLKQNPSFFVTQSVLCSELSKTYYSTWPIGMSDAQLILDHESLLKSFDYCESKFKFSPYDSHKFNLNTPVVYFQGETDPQTPLGGAMYHLDGQANTRNKYFYKIRLGSHSPLQADLTDCAPQIWEHLYSKSYDLSDVLTPDGQCL